MGYPITLNVAGRLCVVVGGGMVALRKVQGLLMAGARVKVISPALLKPFEQLLTEGRIKWEKKLFEGSDLTGAFLAIAATNNPGVNGEVQSAALREKVLVNVVTQPDGGDFSIPALYREGEVAVAVSTDGAAPAYAAHLRDSIVATMPRGVGQTALFLRKLRSVAGAGAGTDAWRGFMASGAVDDLANADIRLLGQRVDEFFGTGTWDKLYRGKVIQS